MKIIFLVFICFYVVNCKDLSIISKPCTRTCDTHFTGTQCWSNTFTHFTNSLAREIIRYYTASKQSKLTPQKIDLLMARSLAKVQKEDGNQLAQVSNINDLTMEIFNKIRYSAMISTTDYNLKCPTKCDSNEIQLYQILFGIFVGLTFLAIILVGLYTIVIKLRYRKIYEGTTKMKANKI